MSDAYAAGVNSALSVGRVACCPGRRGRRRSAARFAEPGAEGTLHEDMHDHTEGGSPQGRGERMHAGEAQHRDEVRQIDRVGSVANRTNTSAERPAKAFSTPSAP